MKSDLLNVEQVSVLIGKSSATINAWYRFARKNPDTDIAKYLPEIIRNNRGVRYWKRSDVDKLIKVQEKIPLGRTGPMGRYGGIGTKNGRKENNT